MLIVLKTEYLSSISDLNSDVEILYKLASLTHDGVLHKVKKGGAVNGFRRRLMSERKQDQYSKGSAHSY